MRWLGPLVLLIALGACKENPPAAPAPEAPVEDAGKPVLPPAPVKHPTPAPLVDPALREGSFATWEVQSPALVASTRATFTVTAIGADNVEVLVTIASPARTKPPPALERGLKFLMARAPLSPEPKLLPPDTTLFGHADAAWHPVAGRNYDKWEARPETITIAGRPIACTRFELKSGGEAAHGCVAAKLSPIAFFGGAVEYEQALVKARLIDWGAGPVPKSDAPLAFRPGQAATYKSDAPDQLPIIDSWFTGGTHVRYLTTEEDSSWDGTLLEVLFDLASLERAEDGAYATSFKVNGDRFAARTFKTNGRGPTDQIITEEWVHAEDPWRLEDAPVWVRFWPLEHGIGATEIDSTLSLREWK